MKSAKLIDIFRQGHIVIPLFLLQHYKELKLEINEFIFLMYLYSLGNKFVFDPLKFSAELNLTTKDVMNYIGILFVCPGRKQCNTIANRQYFPVVFVILLTPINHYLR